MGPNVDRLVTEGFDERLQLILESVSAVVGPYRDAHTNPFRLVAYHTFYRSVRKTDRRGVNLSRGGRGVWGLGGRGGRRRIC